MSKRERNTNFSESDKELLINILSNTYFPIIENQKKKPTGGVKKKKKDAWQAVCNDFNSVTTIQEVHQNLKIAYNNIKRLLQKSSADDKVRLYKTGGGTYTAPQIDDNNARF
ncbi:hypothetical protein CBL_20120 [Carabus blaptoides fortunei]